MRHDAIEIGLAGKTARRRDEERSIRSSISARRQAAEAVASATDAIDEAFAGLSRSASNVSRVDMPKHDQDSVGGTGGCRPKSLSVVTQLAAQLDALDRQREQLAQLLRDIEVTTLAD